MRVSGRTRIRLCSFFIHYTHTHTTPILCSLAWHEGFLLLRFWIELGFMLVLLAYDVGYLSSVGTIDVRAGTSDSLHYAPVSF